ncbi:MAG TPA: thioredoxin family protein [Pseudomonadaceae bacterium]|nr:thioredoxin family protein [Pseudomonadaceae bacterium]
MTTSGTSSNTDYAEEALTFDQVADLPGDTLLNFGAPWCGHCQAASPAIKEVLAEHPGLRHIKIYDGKGRPLGRAFKVKLWPTLVLLREGKEVDRLVRPVRSEEVRQLLSS